MKNNKTMPHFVTYADYKENLVLVLQPEIFSLNKASSLESYRAS
jgi:hypothetical protein